MDNFIPNSIIQEQHAYLSLLESFVGISILAALSGYTITNDIPDSICILYAF